MNITVICDVLGEKNNGTTLATTNLIDYLKKQGHNVTVVCPDEDKKGWDGYVIVPTLYLGKLAEWILKRNGVKLARAKKSVLTEAIKDADVVHIELPFLLGCKAVKIAKKLGKPVTASFHCQAENVTAHFLLMNSKLANLCVYKLFYKHLYRYCDEVHYPTAFIRDVFEGATHKTNSNVISNGVNEEFFAPRAGKRVSDKFTIVCSGRLSKEKAQFQLIKAVGKSKYRNKIKVVFAGDGPFKNKLKKLALKNGVDADFNFFSREEIIDILHGADLYVHTATVEIEAIACLEAIVSGLVPVICNSPKSATVNFAIDDNNLFKMHDEKDLANKIDFWYEHEDLKREYKLKYADMANGFAHALCMDKMEKMIEKAAESGG